MDVNVHSQSLDCNRGTGMVRDRIHRDRISFSYVFYSHFFHHHLHPAPITREKERKLCQTSLSMLVFTRNSLWLHNIYLEPHVTRFEPS